MGYFVNFGAAIGGIAVKPESLNRTGDRRIGIFDPMRSAIKGAGTELNARRRVASRLTQHRAYRSKWSIALCRGGQYCPYRSDRDWVQSRVP